MSIMPRLPSVAVITVTHDRPSIERSIASVSQQDYAGEILHVIVGDQSPYLRQHEHQIRGMADNIYIQHVSTDQHQASFQPVYIPSRLAFLRNLGVDSVASDLIAYLDDDNYYETDHIGSLVKLLMDDQSIACAHSWRQLRHASGAPYTAPIYPWTPQPRLAVSRQALSRHIYSELVAGGVCREGDHVWRDTLTDSRGEKVYTVDTNELLYHRSLHDSVPNIVHYEWRQMVGDFSDDYAWIRRCDESGFEFSCSMRASVAYTVGGISNHTHQLG
jgi:glycosyltransferase involved in cell wall biosynthesis